MTMRYLLFFTLSISLFSCSNSQEKILMSTPWKFDVEATKDILNKETASEGQYNFMMSVMARLQDATLEFKDDNVFVTKIGEKEELGYWDIKGKQMNMVVTKAAVSPYEIIEFSPDRIVLRPATEHQLSFTRVLVPAK
jgi:hypothetical protein